MVVVGFPFLYHVLFTAFGSVDLCLLEIFSLLLLNCPYLLLLLPLDDHCLQRRHAGFPGHTPVCSPTSSMSILPSAPKTHRHPKFRTSNSSSSFTTQELVIALVVPVSLAMVWYGYPGQKPCTTLSLPYPLRLPHAPPPVQLTDSLLPLPPHFSPSS